MINQFKMGFRITILTAVSTFAISCGGGGGGGAPEQSEPPDYPDDLIPDPYAPIDPFTGAKAVSPYKKLSFMGWMHKDVRDAWNDGFTGKGSKITVVDFFLDEDTFWHNIEGKPQERTHGEAVSLTASMIAPDADIQWYDYYASNEVIELDDSKFNVINASFGSFSRYKSTWGLGAHAESMIDHAHNGTAVVVQSAGNDFGSLLGERVDNIYSSVHDHYDMITLGLKGADSVIFAGSLEHNGTVNNPAEIASYSTIPGDDTYFQEHYLMVGVDEGEMGVIGTSFAAPIISGYAAIVGQKFPDATPVEVTNQLLDTATTNTIVDYDPYFHGQGEASLSRALAPVSIN